MSIKKLLGIAIITLVMGLIGCGTSSGYSLPSNEHSIAKTRLKDIIEAIENKDKEGLKDMFSPNALKEATDMEAGVDYIMGIYKGKILSLELEMQTGDKSTDDGEITNEIFSDFIVTTEEDTYVVDFLDKMSDSKDADNIGLYNLLIMKKSDKDKVTKGYQDRGAGVYLPTESENYN